MRKIRVEYNQWKDLEYALEQAKLVMQEHEFENLPFSNKLQELGYSSLSNAISRYHGGFSVFRRLLGQTDINKKSGTWKSLEYALEQARKIKRKHGFEKLPNLKKLVELGYSSLSGSIGLYHGGFHNFRELLGEKNSENTKISLLETVLQEDKAA